MMHRLYSLHKGLKTAGLMLALGAVFGSCTVDEATDPYADIDAIKFTATGEASLKQETRAVAADKIFDITATYYPCKFYIKEKGTDLNGVEKVDVGTYAIPSGSSAILTPYGAGNKGLNWFSRNNPHYFWAFTVPNLPDFDPETVREEDVIEFQFRDTSLDDTTNGKVWKTEADAEPGYVNFENGHILEQMLGTYRGPRAYNTDGLYVPLQFRHMTSKVLLRSFNIINNVTGNSNGSCRGVIYFYGAPKTTYLHTCPVDKNGNNTWAHLELSEAPEGWDYDPLSYITYAITNNPMALDWDGHVPNNNSTKYLDYWYLPPELEFDKMSFKIVIYTLSDGKWVPDETYGLHGAYYGDFSNIKFDRNGTGYDDGNKSTTDIYKLHAGEYMELTLNLYQSGEATAQGDLVQWDHVENRFGSAHVRDGIYTVQDLLDLSNIMYTNAGPGDPETIDYYYEVMGSGRSTADDPEGEYADYKDILGRDLLIFDIFDDIGRDDVKYDDPNHGMVSDLYLDPRYIYDGHGHTITIDGVSIFGGNLRDVYLHYYYSTSGYERECFAYVDKKGELWTIDLETGEMTATGHFCIVEEGNTRLIINIEDGYVSQSAG